MSLAYKGFGAGNTKQNEPILGREERMGLNSTGAIVFKTSWEVLLTRFLILGTTGGSYYASEKKLTKDVLRELLPVINSPEGKKVVDIIVDISYSGRAFKNEPAIFALAVCASSTDPQTRSYALTKISSVCRISTHLFHFLEYVQEFRGWGSGLRKAVAEWYLSKSSLNLAYQITKYKNRDGWTHKDALRLSHPKTTNETTNFIFKHILGKPQENSFKIDSNIYKYITDISNIFKLNNTEICSMVQEHNLPIEVIPTEKRTEDVYKTLLSNRPNIGWLLRNLGNISSKNLINKDTLKIIEDVFLSEENLKKARIHPLGIYLALSTYKQGKGNKGNLTWSPNRDVIYILEKAFDLSFKAIEPTRKRILCGLDVSGSMQWADIQGIPGLTPAVGTALMSKVLNDSEENCKLMAFSDQFIELPNMKGASLDYISNKIKNLPFSHTDCTLPIVYAQKNNLAIDAFVIMTDNETNSMGSKQPQIALEEYRRQTGIDAKLIVVAFTATKNSIADPNDKNTMECVGFDSNVPWLITKFIKGNI